MNHLYVLLKSQKLGIICGWGVAGLLALGSLVMNFFSNHYQGLGGEDIRFFFQSPHPLHFWFYLLFICCVLYALNALLCTWDSLAAKLKGKVKWLPAYGAAILHISFLLALVSHLVAGFGADNMGRGVLGTEPVEAGPLTLRLVDLQTTTYPSGMLKTAEGLVEYQWKGRTEKTTIGYNQPLTAGAGVWEVLLLDQGRQAWGISLAINSSPGSPKEAITLTPAKPVEHGQYRLSLQELYLPPAFRVPVALLSVEHKGQNQQVILPMGQSTEVNPQLTLSFQQVLSSPYITVNLKKNSGIPLVLAAIVVFLVGLPLVVWRIAAVKTRKGDRLS